MLKNFEYLAIDRNGYQVVKECIELASPDQRKELLDCVVTQIAILINNEFGNFVL